MALPNAGNAVCSKTSFITRKVFNENDLYET